MVVIYGRSIHMKNEMKLIFKQALIITIIVIIKIYYRYTESEQKFSIITHL